MEEWLLVDEAFAPQMARKEQLLDLRREEVISLDDSAQDAAGELLDLVLATAFRDQKGYRRILRPDGARVTLDRGDALGTLGRLVQEDFCILHKSGDAHHLTGAVLCFPASWTLSEKFMQPLTGIHAPVEGYDDTMGRRVQRLFDGVRPGRPLWRFNALWYPDSELHQPRSMTAPRAPCDPRTARYLRSERQCIVRLPRTGAVVFSIHTYVLARKDAVALMQNAPPHGRGV